MGREDPLAILERWTAHGADYRVVHLSDAAAIVELRTCTGEQVDLLESSDQRLIERLRRDWAVLPEEWS